MKICHVSDTHGRFPELEGDFDLVVHSGDFAPNCRGTAAENAEFQNDWLSQKLVTIRDWLRGKPLFFCPGNHDFFVDYASALDGYEGMVVKNLTNRIYGFEDFGFTGLPHVPWFGGGWNFEAPIEVLEDRTNEAIERLNEHYDSDKQILVAHCPPYGVLDRVPRGEFIGNYPLKKRLTDGTFSPRAILCGHCHESEGSTMFLNTYVSNAACSQRLIQLNDV